MEHQPLADETVHRGHRRKGGHTDQGDDGQGGQRTGDPAVAVHLPLAGDILDGIHNEHHQRLEHAVVQGVQDPRQQDQCHQAPRTIREHQSEGQAHGDQCHVLHAGVGEYPLGFGLDHGFHGAPECRDDGQHAQDHSRDDHVIGNADV